MKRHMVSVDRDKVADAIDALVALLDTIDSDPEAEDDDPQGDDHCLSDDREIDVPIGPSGGWIGGKGGLPTDRDGLAANERHRPGEWSNANSRLFRSRPVSFVWLCVKFPSQITTTRHTALRQ